jgi:peptide/nickel transport system permease protein
MRVLLRILGYFIGTLVAVSLVIFGIVHLTPGDIASIHNLSENTAHQLFLDRSLPVQYGLWLWGCLRGNFGISMVDGTPVTKLLLTYAPPTLLLTFGSLICSLILAVPLGVWRGLRPVSMAGKITSLLAYTFSALPVFVLGYLVLGFVFGVFRVYITSPPEGEFHFWAFAGYYGLPILVLALGNGTVGEFVRFISMETQGINRSMHIRAVRARGTSLSLHLSRSLVLPVYNIMVTNMAVLLGGLVVVERVFNFHGLGWLSWEATLKRDFPVIMGITLVMAILIRIFMLLGDLLAWWLDPRMREN